MTTVIRLHGQTFGHLTVLHRKGSFRRYAAWLCKCVCGEEVIVSGHHLRRGLRKSCARNGHYWFTSQPPSLATLHPSEYQSWESMRRRCYDKKHRKYYQYGRRGIRVCTAWKNSFEDFFKDMGIKPDSSYTVDRIDNYKGYEPGNCKWSTRKEQMRNTRRSVYIEQGGQLVLLIDVAAKAGIDRNIVYQRLRIGWDLDEALSTPVHKKKVSNL